MNKFSVKYIDNCHIEFENQILGSIEHGGCRIIFMTDEYVIKCDNWDEPDNSNSFQCEKEWINYNNKFKNKKIFIPILDFGEIISGYYYVIQPRVYGEYDISSKYFNTVRNIEKRYKLNDLHNENYLLIGKKVRIFDYAF